MKLLLVGGLVSSLVLAGVSAPIARGIAQGRGGGGEEFTDTFRLDHCHFASTGKNPYFPLIPGSRRFLEGREEGELVQLLITTLHQTEKVDGVKTRILEERETHDGELVEVSRNFFVQCKENGAVFYFGEDVDIYEDGEIVSHAGAWRAGRNGARAGLVMPGLPLLGSRFFQEVAPGVALDRSEQTSLSEVVNTRAGTFTDCLLVVETTPLEPGAEEEKLYAPDVGLVQDGALKLVSLTSSDDDDDDDDGDD